ncbi:hypothetical protein HJFPF1_11226 [Paramyrothecium foliicola]|nr:hypothetical protein HJFPF1_11226 [Paramyrothecium foliicola]
MPSQRQSWFARHCAPPPPINAASACPCTSCFNGAASPASSLSRRSSRRVYAMAGAGDSRTALLTDDADAQSVRSYDMAAPATATTSS